MLGDGFPIYSMEMGDQWKWEMGSEINGNVPVHRSTDHKLDKVRHPPLIPPAFLLSEVKRTL